jgi:CHAD domain-containing protein
MPHRAANRLLAGPTSKGSSKVSAEAPTNGSEDVVVFDTDDHRLTRAGITLERCSDATTAGWTLILPVSAVRGKKPDSVDGRFRLFEPLGTNPGVVPGAFLALVRARSLGRPLQPVPVGPGVLASDLASADLASAEPPTDSVDLGDADPGELAVAHLSTQFERLVAFDSQVRLGLDDSIHQARVALRKLRSDLATFRPLLDRERAQPLRGELSWLSGVLGAARDAEVLRERLEAELLQQPAAMIIGPVRRRLDRELGHQYRQGHIAVVQALNSVRYVELLRNLERFLAQPPLKPDPALSPLSAGSAGSAAVSASATAMRPIRRYPVLTELADDEDEAWRREARELQLTALVAKAHARLLRANRVAAAAETPAEREFLLHEVRKAAKRSRYAADAVRPVLGKPAKRYARAAAGVQEVLGDNQDAVVLRARLLTLAERATAAGESAFTYGRVHARLEQRAELDEAQLHAAWVLLIDVAATWPG